MYFLPFHFISNAPHCTSISSNCLWEDYGKKIHLANENASKEIVLNCAHILTETYHFTGVPSPHLKY